LNKIKVSVVNCSSYDPEILDPALGRCLGALNCFRDIIKPGKKILLKPNLLSPNSPEKAITTHPLFVEAIIKKIVDVTGQPENITLADSCVPILPYTESGLKKLYEATGMINLPKRTGINLNYDNRVSKVFYADGISIKQFDTLIPAVEADIIINIPKLKTHNLTVTTGAVKNMFGIIPGMSKPGFHTRFFNISMFCNMLIDIVCAADPQLTIMDGILGMEGDGPGNGGTPRKTNLILSSIDPFALDNIASNIMGLGEDDNPVLTEAKKRNFSGAFIESIELLGGLISELKIDGFKLPRASVKEKETTAFGNLIKKVALNGLNPYPIIDRRKCIGNSCKTCKRICPRGAISDSRRNEDALIFDYNKCIRCFCCSEVCPTGAVENKYTLLGNIIVNGYGLGGKKKLK